MLLKKIDLLYIVFDVAQNVISLPVNVCQAHSSDGDNFLCLSSILVYTKFRRQCLLSSLRHQRKVHKSSVLTELTQLTKESWHGTSFSWAHSIINGILWSCSVNQIISKLVSTKLNWLTKGFLFWHIEFNRFICWF